MGEKYKPTEEEIDEAQRMFKHTGFSAAIFGSRVSRREARRLASYAPEARAMVEQLRAREASGKQEVPNVRLETAESTKEEIAINGHTEQVEQLRQEIRQLRGEENNGEDF